MVFRLLTSKFCFEIRSNLHFVCGRRANLKLLRADLIATILLYINIIIRVNVMLDFIYVGLVGKGWGRSHRELPYFPQLSEC